MDMAYPLHLIDLLAKLYRKQLAKVKVVGTLSEWFLVQEGDGECTTEFRTRLNRGRRSGHHCRKYGKVTAYRFHKISWTAK